MSSGHRDDVPQLDERLESLVTEEAITWVVQRVGEAEVNTDYEIPLIACRSIDCMTVYIDCNLPQEMNAKGQTFDPADTLPWHEVSEWYFEHVIGLPYLDAHRIATWAFEKPFVESIGLDWDGYQEAFGGEIADNEERYKGCGTLNAPADLDLAPYKEEDASWALKEMQMEGSKVIDYLKKNGLYDTLAKAAGVQKDATAADVHQTTALGNGKPKRPKKTIVLTDGKKPEEGSVTEEAVETTEEEATEKRGVDADWQTTVAISKLDPEQRLVFGWASVSQVGDKVVIDKQGDIIPIAELEKAAYRFVLESRQQGDMHSEIGVGRVVQSMMFTPEAAGLNITAKNATGENIYGWYVGFKVDSDALWAAVKAGNRPEFSIGGRSRAFEQPA